MMGCSLVRNYRAGGGKPKPDVVWREAEEALTMLASQWIERVQYIQEGSPGQDRTPPVLIIVCDNTDIAEVFFRNISGEEIVPALDDVLDEEDSDLEEPQPRRGRSFKTKTVYGQGKPFSEYFSNREPTAVFVKPTVGYHTGNPGTLGPGRFEQQDREEYYRSTHL